MDVDELMDLAIKAGRDTFGRAVAYRPRSGVAVSLVGIYTPRVEQVNPALGTLEFAEPRLEFRSADLDDAGVAPTSDGDTVTVTIDAVERTYRVVRVERGDVGSTMCYLGARS